jgi:SPP1 family phage portal protein
MTAFSRAYQVKDQAGAAHSYFETYTATERWLWELDSANGYQVVEGFPKKIEIGKIPVVFGCQPQVEWADVQGLIDRLEKLLSNFADTNDYHASPKIFVTGKILGFAKKGEAGSIIEGEKDSSAEYLAWQNAPESVKLEITTLLNLIYTLTQTPDISFESVKGLSAMSGVALKLLFMDAHLKVADHREVFDEYMQRRINILKAFIATANKSLATDCSALMVEPEITPYMIEDDKAKVDMVVAANGNKPAISQKLSAKILGLAKDPDKDYEQMQTEEAARNTFDIAEPSF